MAEKKARKKKEKPKAEFQNLLKINGKWTFEVLRKDGNWTPLGGLSGDTSRADAEKFAQSTAELWRKR
jgi:hypothetical protein